MRNITYCKHSNNSFLVFNNNYHDYFAFNKNNPYIFSLWKEEMLK